MFLLAVAIGPDEMNRLPPDDVLEGPGFTMKRYGRFIEMQSHRTAEEQAGLLKAIWETRQRILTRIQEATNELSALIHRYTSFDLVANLWLRHGPFNTEVYKETESTQRPHFVEHATILQLRDPAYQLTGEVFVAAEDLTRAEELLAELFGLTAAYYGAEAADPALGSGPPSALDELRRKTLLREMMVGPPAYTHHWMTILEGLFGAKHIDVYLNEVLGFSLKAAISCAHAIGALMRETLLQRSQTAQKSQDDMKQQLKR